MKRFAFTLSEILVTLGIIGVIAVLTVPNITKNIYAKTDIATLQSTLKNINDSVKSMMVNERVTRISDSSLGSSTMESFFNKYLKVTKICDDPSNCFAAEYKTHSGSTVPLGQDIDYAIQIVDIKPIAMLPSGASVLFVERGQLFASGNEFFEDVDGNPTNVFIVDVNGPRKPNLVGSDLFAFSMDDRGNVGYLGELPEDVLALNELRATCRSGSGYGLSCAYLLQIADWDAKTLIKKYPDDIVEEAEGANE